MAFITEEHDLSDQIQQRLKAGQGQWSAIGIGWLPLIEEMDAKLSKLYPNYVIDQVREVDGLLHIHVSGIEEAGYAIIKEVQSRSGTMCEVCGTSANINRIKDGWIVVRCDDHMPKYHTLSYGVVKP